MPAPCPRCQTVPRDKPVTIYVCSKCGHRWPRPLRVPTDLEVQRAEGEEPLGTFDLVSLREMLYTGTLTGRERARLPGTVGWQPLADQPALQDLLEMLDITTPKQSRIQGWKVQKDEQSAEPAWPLPEPDLPNRGPPTAEPRLTTPMLLLLTAIGLGALGLFAWGLS